MSKKAIIIGAGPAGLTAAYELLKHTDIKPIMFEADKQVGGISRTVEYKGNRLDIGGHRFFSRSERILKWWFDIMPLERPDRSDLTRSSYFEKELLSLLDPATQIRNRGESDEVILLRNRLSRIYFRNKLFNYPLALTVDTAKGLGFSMVVQIAWSYILARLFPTKPEKNLEDFFINRFGRRFYETFFREYTKKVWGVPCRKIGTEWGAQRIKGLSLSRAIRDAAKRICFGKNSLMRRSTETSLINEFLYPKYGPGQLWEKVACQVVRDGGKIFCGQRVVGIYTKDNQVIGVDVLDEAKNEITKVEGEYFVSTMPVCDLIRSFRPEAPAAVRDVSDNLAYMDFMTVGMLFKKMRIQGKNRPMAPDGLIPDNWIYVQEPRIRMGRIQIFNNWSPYMVSDPHYTWIGAEYFCKENNALWSRSDQGVIQLAVRELEHMGLTEERDYLDGTVVRMTKTYPGYFGSYDKFQTVRDFTDTFYNLFLIGRNGMHRYNNQDHSMLTAMTAVENIKQGRYDKSNIWRVNTEQDYQEDRITSVDNLTASYKERQEVRGER